MLGRREEMTPPLALFPSHLQEEPLTLQWIEEVRSICGRSIPVLLVACKTDLREKAKANGTFSPDRYIDKETVSLGRAPD